MLDLFHNAVPVALINNNAAVAATQQSNYVDLEGYLGVIFVLIADGNTGDATNYFTPTVQEATATPGSTSSYSAVAAGDLFGSWTVLNTTNEVIDHVGYRGNSRYVNVALTETLTASQDVTLIALLIPGRKNPSNSDSPTTGTVS